MANRSLTYNFIEALERGFEPLDDKRDEESEGRTGKSGGGKKLKKKTEQDADHQTVLTKTALDDLEVAESGSTFLGMDFKKFDFPDIDKKDVFFGLQVMGGLMLGASGVVDGNNGRAITGFGNATRNVTWFPIKKMLGERTAQVIAPVLAVTTNMPQLMSATSLAEQGAATAVIAAYTLMAMPEIKALASEALDKFKGKKEIEKNNGFFEKLKVKVSESKVFGIVKRTWDDSSELARKFAGTAIKHGPAALLASRASLQIVDGYMRDDYAMMASGVAFLAGSLALSGMTDHVWDGVKNITEKTKTMGARLRDKLEFGENIDKEQQLAYARQAGHTGLG